jgi:SpoVK/Ycf46/Vps4 family AAA+-type ATPase|tara:strand:+ start:730 stop:1200 length:471 start_codon:yes stop_codon:yes gene_type:complete
MKKIFGIMVLCLLLSGNAYSGEYSGLLKKAKTKNSDKLLKVLDETILGLEFEKDVVQICYDAIRIINREKLNKTINEIKKCEPLVNRYMDYIDLTKIYENKNFAKKLDKIYYKIQDGKITSVTLKDFENKLYKLGNVAKEIDDLYTEIRLLDPRDK